VCRQTRAWISLFSSITFYVASPHWSILLKLDTSQFHSFLASSSTADSIDSDLSWGLLIEMQ